MTLDQWMKANGLTNKSVGEIAGVHKTSIWKMRRGLRKVSPKVMNAIVLASHGAVTRPELRPDLYPEVFTRSVHS